jgi:hypothetical protein
MISEQLYFNGINAETGEYDLPPMTVRELTSFIQGETPPENLQELRYRRNQKTTHRLSIREGIDPSRLAEAGWGVIFAYDCDPAIREALKELLDLRAAQAGPYFKILEGPRPGESKDRFLGRYGAQYGSVDPQQVPYYLLIVASPEQISFEFQAQLDVQYSVGRIYFETPQEYAHYAHSVKLAESGLIKLPRQATFFGVVNPNDPVTHSMAERLVNPLCNRLAQEKSGWQINRISASEATKTRLAGLLGGAQTPALLGCAGHGVSFSNGSPRLLRQQGALLCQDWPGPGEWMGRPIPEDFYFAGDDLAPEANLLGLIAVFFAAYGAGTPNTDLFVRQTFKKIQPETRPPFLARLPMNMLAHPGGGALAVLSYVDRAWGYTLPQSQSGRQTEPLESALLSLLNGATLGAAIDYLNDRYAETSAILSEMLDDIEFGKQYDPYQLAELWLANKDARSYAILGDPAVRMPVVTGGETPCPRPERIVLETVQIPSTGSPTPEKTAPVALETSQTNGATNTEGKSSLEGGLFMDTSTSSLQDVTQSMLEFSQKLLRVMQQSIDDMSSVTVRSCLVENPDELPLQAGAAPFAVTRVNLDGDTQVFVSNQGGGPSPELMKLHNDTVQITLAWRTETFKAMSDTLGSWLRPAAGSEK